MTTILPTWAALEIMGHQRIAWFVSETMIAGEGFLRIQVPDETDGFVGERVYSPKALFSMTACPEATIREAVKREREQREAEERRRAQYQLGAPTVPAFISHDEKGAVELQSVKELVDEWRTTPDRRTGSIVVSTIESFVALVNRDSNESSVIFADNGPSPKLVAVLNFHEASGTPEFCDDRIVYPFPLSDEWKAWMGQSGESRKMGQAAFAEFIEDHLFDIGEPGAAGETSKRFAETMGVRFAGPSEMMRISRGFSVRVEETIVNSTKRESGEVELIYKVEHTDKDGAESVKVPAAFHLSIPVLRGEAHYSIPVRLRYRLSGGKISLFFEPHRPELFLLDAVKEAIERVKAPEDAVDLNARGCGLMVVMGTPPGA